MNSEITYLLGACFQLSDAIAQLDGRAFRRHRKRRGVESSWNHLTFFRCQLEIIALFTVSFSHLHYNVI